MGIFSAKAQSNVVILPNQNGGTNGLNVSVGFAANQFVNPLARWNTFIGANAGITNTTGERNTFIGFISGNGSSTSNGNTTLGFGSFQASTGNNNIVIGLNAGNFLSNSNNNLLIGENCGFGLTVGNSNTFLGPVIVPSALSTATTGGNDTNNTIILADGVGNQRFYVHNNGRIGLGLGNNQIPQNRLEINSAGSFNSTPGLRFRNFINTNYSTAVPTSNRRVLTINNVGDVILVDDVGTTGTTFTSTCATNNFVPKSTGASSMVCSQIFDNGTSVGINATGSFTYNNSSNPPFSGGTVPNTGTVRFDVNGVIRTVGIFATSDKKFKKNIESIENPLETIQKLDGKTYLWNKEANKEMDFDNGLHSGFIAQDLEKVLPHLVITNEKGDKAVNYTELIPYLVEAIKDQQTQINDLKTQISEKFKSQNQDLIQLNNTKIISVSPNPSKDVISVSLNVEKGIENALLQVYDLSGKLLSSLNVKERDNNISKTFQKDNFGTGVYIVSLVINGKSIDSKKIIFE